MPRRARLYAASVAALAGVCVTAALPAAAQQPEIRPGLWEMTLSGTANVKQNVCLTPAMVKDMKQMAAKGDPSSDCKASAEKVSGASRMFDITCTKPAAYQASVVVTVDGPDRFSMSQDYSMAQGGKKQQGKLAMTYRRIGDCKA
jgi:hypothetical protein